MAVVTEPNSYKSNVPGRGDVLATLGIGAAVFVSRLPFLEVGYGNINDAWRVASAARRMATTGEYVASRFPPHPVQEVLCSLLWKGGPLVLNGATAFFSAVAMVFFALTMRTLGHKDDLFASLALAFTPVIFINSTNLTDYLWALAFMLGSLYLVLVRRPILAGAFLGIAVGCRITSAVMLIPLSLLIVQRRTSGDKWVGLATFSLVTCMVSALTLAPAVFKYGVSFFTFYEDGYPLIFDVVKRATLEIWGLIGILAVALAAIAMVIRLATPDERARVLTSAGWYVPVWLLTILLYVIAFLRLPHLSGYLIPAIPFFILLLAAVLSRYVFRIFCIMVIFSSFISIGRSGLSPGPIFADNTKRIEGVKSVERILSLGSRLGEKSIVIAGHWYPKLEVYTSVDSKNMVTYVWLLDRAQLQEYRSQGYSIYYLPREEETNLEFYGVDPRNYGAVQLTF